MPIAKYSALQKLIISLTKAEKRHFALYVNRLNSNKSVLFVKLFNLIDRYPQYHEEAISKKLNCSPTQFINAKRHLYGQLLKSLRLLHEDSDHIFKLRQKLDFAKILYKKGQFKESLSLLDNHKLPIKLPAFNILSLEIAEFRKLIESRHITRSRNKLNQVEQLIKYSIMKRDLINIETKMSNVALEAQGLYIKWGFAKDHRDLIFYQLFFQNQLPPYSYVRVSPMAEVMWHQSLVWFYYMQLKFHFAYRHAVSWVEKIYLRESFLKSDADLTMRGYHYILTCCFYLNREDKFDYWFERYKRFRLRFFGEFNDTSKALDFCYFQNASLNLMLIKRKFHKIDSFSLQIRQGLNKLYSQVDVHRIMIFNYKLAITYSYKGDYLKALDYLNLVIANADQKLNSDILNYARFIQLMCHYRVNNFTLVTNLIPSIKIGFESINRMNGVIETMIMFLRRGSRAMNFGIKEMINLTTLKVGEYKTHPFDKVAFLYYDFEAWLQSVGQNTSIDKLPLKD